MSKGVLVLLVGLLAGCQQAAEPLYLPNGEDYPEQLSDWGMLTLDDGVLRPQGAVTPYDLNTPLFSDYAHKLRTVWLPPGTQANYAAEHFDYPVGTVLSKTFYYPKSGDGTLQLSDSRSPAALANELPLAQVQLIETRLLVHQEQGWVALPYVWDADQQEARLAWIGTELPLSARDSHGQVQHFTYTVPDANQCLGCHAQNHVDKELRPLGPKARHLNKDYPYAVGVQNQLAYWQARGLLVGVPAEPPQAALWPEPRAHETLEQQARSYLDINCGHCHNPKGAARTSALWLDSVTTDPLHLGLCKAPIAAGKGTGDRPVAISPGRPQDSILSYRMASLDPGEMMPELGRSLAHAEGVTMIEQWIKALPAPCND
ncbi:SO2930 family diheme c-type cytochrome [Atopomonas sediminilitoris]|uniref:SO2930 family diheme c-type cytochrome n=1 Tax=Atopomonas sediminilitoris TaxID=2919919 RepID=UPI001F4E8256|nr:SO2930 family diheme c-type cytochrome [Atopomonas sediminilitoris]MCJ8170218.1 hypothetical protein [Atopomonas sediminilitoris]